MQNESDSDKLIIILCHISLFLGVGLLLPLVVYLWKKDSAGPIAEHAKEALNFHISLMIYGIISFCLVIFIVGIFMLMVVGIGGAVLAIIGAIQGASGKFYRYPATLRLVS